MGYSTGFTGQFRMDRLPSAEIIVALRELESFDGREGDKGQPDAYCQWVLTKDCKGIEWDGNEKFYEYEEWLQWIIDNVLAPGGVTLSGFVQYQGEGVGDCGVLAIRDGKVIKTEAQIVADELADLLRFKTFVLDHRDSGRIIGDWKRQEAKGV